MRLSKDEYFLRMAGLVAQRSTCARRQVGCVLVDKHSHVIATGYNGVPRGEDHCIDKPCEGAQAEIGEGLSLCQATHAEANALLQCKDVEAIHTAYCTTLPCTLCSRLLANTSVTRIVYADSYPNVTYIKHVNYEWLPLSWPFTFEPKHR